MLAVNAEQLEGFHSSFDKLDGFSLLSILDHLNIDESISIADLAPRHHESILKYCLIGRHKLNEQEITINLGKEPYMMIQNTNQRFAIGPDRIFHVLKGFGRIFSRLKIHIYPDSVLPLETLSHILNRFCSEARQEIILHKLIEKNLKFSFENATKVGLYRIISRANDISLTDIFPAMKELEIRDCLSLAILSRSFPRLTRFILYVNFDTDDNPDLLGFFLSNPQLRSLEISLTKNNTFLQKVNEMLPNLQSLTIQKPFLWPYFSRDEIIHFRNVKHFTWASAVSRTGYWDIKVLERFASITFEQLETLSLDIDENYSAEKHVPHVIRNKGVVKVEILKCEMTYKYLALLIEGLPALEELAIGWSAKRTLPALQRFLLVDMQVKRLRIHIIDKKVLQPSDILNIVPSSWKQRGEEVMNAQKSLLLERTN